MKKKPKKDLAHELIDDLLGEESLKPEPDEAPTMVRPPPSKEGEDSGVLELFFDEIQDPSESNASDNESIFFDQRSPSITPQPQSPPAQVSPSQPSSPRATTQQQPDETVRLRDSQVLSSPVLEEPTKSKGKEPAVEPVHRAAVGRAVPFGSSGFRSPTEAVLAQSETLRLAQQRILELESEVERLRSENEQLASAGETFRRKSDELLSLNEKLDHRARDIQQLAEQEKGMISDQLAHQTKEVQQLRSQNEELQLRLSTSLQKVRVRERELENRLELLKMESTALIRSKDELILDLKRQVDQLNMELENFRTKGQELHRVFAEKQEQMRRTVKALRLALSMLEGESEAMSTPKGKAS